MPDSASEAVEAGGETASNAEVHVASGGGKKKARHARFSKSHGDAAPEPTGITFAPLERSSIVTLSRDRRSVTGSKGYKLVRATAGVDAGTWFCEFTLDLKADGHVRLGFANDAADTSAPVGFDQHSYAVRDVGGTRVHQSIRSTYAGASLRTGDVIGCLITFTTPEDVLRHADARDDGASAGPADAMRQAAAVVYASSAGATREGMAAVLLDRSCGPQRPEWALEGAAAARAVSPAMSPQPTPTATSYTSGVVASSPFASAAVPTEVGPSNTKKTVNQRFWGSSIRFYVNGKDLGVAFIHLTKEERYFPAASCYNGASVKLNAGPTFTFPPVLPYDAVIRPFSEVQPTSFGMPGQMMNINGMKLVAPLPFGAATASHAAALGFAPVSSAMAALALTAPHMALAQTFGAVTSATDVPADAMIAAEAAKAAGALVHSMVPRKTKSSKKHRR